MSKNTDFFKLGPYSCKNSIRTGTGTKIGQTESNRAKTTSQRARKCASRRPHARQLLRSRRLFSPFGWHLQFGPALQATRVVTLLELCCFSRRSTRVRRLSPPSDLFYLFIYYYYFYFLALQILPSLETFVPESSYLLEEFGISFPHVFFSFPGCLFLTTVTT